MWINQTIDWLIRVLKSQRILHNDREVNKKSEYKTSNKLKLIWMKKIRKKFSILLNVIKRFIQKIIAI